MAGKSTSASLSPNGSNENMLLQPYMPQGVTADQVYRPTIYNKAFTKTLGGNLSYSSYSGKTYGEIAQERLMRDLQAIGLGQQQDQPFQMPTYTPVNPYAEAQVQTGNVNQFGRPRYLSNADSPFVGMTNGKPNFQRPQGLLKQEQ